MWKRPLPQLNFPLSGLFYIWLIPRGKTCIEHILGESKLGHIVFCSDPLCRPLSFVNWSGRWPWELIFLRLEAGLRNPEPTAFNLLQMPSEDKGSPCFHVPHKLKKKERRGEREPSREEKEERREMRTKKSKVAAVPTETVSLCCLLQKAVVLWMSLAQNR